MPTSPCRQAYDHRLRDTVCEERNPCFSICRFLPSSTACLLRMFVMGKTRFPRMGDTLIGAGAVAQGESLDAEGIGAGAWAIGPMTTDQKFK